MNNLWKKIIVWLRLQQLQADSLIKDKVMKLVSEDIKTEEITECQHDKLVKILNGNIFYKCSKCKRVFMLTVSPSWSEQGFKQLLNEFKGAYEMDNSKKKN